MDKLIKKFSKPFRYGEKGFTLIELLIVIAVLGILAAVAIPNVSNFISTGHKAADQTELATVGTAIQAYMAGNNQAVPAQGDLISSGLVTGTLLGTYTITAVTGEISKAVYSNGWTYTYTGTPPVAAWATS